MIAKGSGFIKGNRVAARARLSAHLKYIEHRSRELDESREDRHIFSKEDDSVSRQEAMDETMSHTSRAVNYHKIVLSPGQDEPVEDWREWTRQVMNDLEESQGKELHWFAVHHENTEHPHVHVVLAGSGQNHETGKEEAVKLYADDYQAMRASGIEHSDHEWHQQIQEFSREGDELERQELEQSRDDPDRARVIDERGDFER